MKDFSLMILLSARGAFNAAVRHIKKALGILDLLEGGGNFADALRLSRSLSNTETLSLLRLLLVDKLGYAALSANPSGFAGDLPALAGEFAGWKAVDMVAVFHDPRFLGVVNLKNAGQLAALGRPLPRELLTVYAGGAWDLPRELSLTAARTALALLSGAVPEIPPELRERGKGGMKKNAPPVKPPGEPRRTPLYSVRVSNELFHYGNVEAWKRVIGEYENAHPGCKVCVFFGGEPLLDLNALFTWGKAPWGSVIQFCVASNGAPGSAIRDIPRLRRRLAEASGRNFEPLLGGSAAGGLSLW
jgi:hypothetical protein